MSEHAHASANECLAIRCLHAAGYTIEYLNIWMGYSKTTISKHANGECDCPDIDGPISLPEIDTDEIEPAMDEQGYSRHGLATEIGVTTATVRSWIREDAHPSPRYRLALDDTLGIGDRDT